MDMTSIQAALGGLKTATDIAQAMMNLRDVSALQAKTIELQKAILDAQASAIAAYSDQSSLLNRVRQLEEEVARMKAWDAEKQRYMLNQVRDGVFTYVLKEEERASEPVHQLCANCYDVHKRKSILQLDRLDVGRTHLLVCAACKADIVIQGHRPTGRR